MARTLGQQWVAQTVVQAASDNTVAVTARQRQFEEDARVAILRIPGLIEQAVAARKDEIVILPNVLNGSDVACGDVDEFVKAVGRNAVRADQLAGRARIIFNFCTENDLAVYVKGVSKYDETLVAKKMPEK